MAEKFPVRFICATTVNTATMRKLTTRFSEALASFLPPGSTMQTRVNGVPSREEVVIFLSNDRDCRIPDNVIVNFEEMKRKNPRAVLIHISNFLPTKRYREEFRTIQYGNGIPVYQVSGNVGHDNEMLNLLGPIIRPLVSDFSESPNAYAQIDALDNSKGTQTDNVEPIQNKKFSDIETQTDIVETPTVVESETQTGIEGITDIYTPGDDVHSQALRQEEYDETQAILKRHANRQQMIEREKAKITQRIQQEERQSGIRLQDNETQTDISPRITPAVSVDSGNQTLDDSVSTNSITTVLENDEIEVLERAVEHVDEIENVKEQRQYARAILLLEAYLLTKKEQKREYKYGIFSKIFGYSRREYMMVALKLVDHYSGEDVIFSKRDIKVLTSGHLYDTYEKIKKDASELPLLHIETSPKPKNSRT